MTTPTSFPPYAALLKNPFVGLHQHLCFVPDWLPRSARGYGSLTAKELRGTVSAHRMVVMLFLGQLADGHMALHRCGNAQCHNPHHLYVGGDTENRRDKLLHQHATERWGSSGVVYAAGDRRVFMPQPLVLSEEACRLATHFAGFSAGKCLRCDWLYPTIDGYVQLRETRMSGEVVGAHRRVYLLFNGPLSKYDIVSHTCDDRTCLNPFHLYVSGRQASHRDFDLQHDKRFRLSTHGLALIANFANDAAELAKELGVHPQTVVSLRAALRRSLNGADGGVLR